MLFPKSHKKIRPGADRVNSSASARSPARLDPSFEPRSRKTSGCITRHAQADGTRTSRTRRIRARARSRSNLHPACVSLARTRRAYLAVGSQKSRVFDLRIARPATVAVAFARSRPASRGGDLRASASPRSSKIFAGGELQQRGRRCTRATRYKARPRDARALERRGGSVVLFFLQHHAWARALAPGPHSGLTVLAVAAVRIWGGGWLRRRRRTRLG